MINLLTERIPFLRGRKEESKILFIYRYLSLLITSSFYLLNNSQHLIGKKIFIIGCLTISAVILSYLYTINEESDKNIKTLLLMEVVGNSILLIPSGGMKGPFIWYTLNTLMISSIFLRKRDSWIILFLHMFFLSSIGYFNTDNQFNILELLKDESNLILSILMIIIAIQAWSIYVKKMKEKSKEIQEANNQLNLLNYMIVDSMEHIGGLYESINILSSQGNREGTIKLLFQHLRKITKTNLVFYYDISGKDGRLILDSEYESILDLEEYIKENLNNIFEGDIPQDISLSNTSFKIIGLKSNYGRYGVLGMETIEGLDNTIYENNIYQLQFLSKLMTVAFDRLYQEEINERLLVTEEQNRIANEIHDSVLQRLFSMSCGIFALIKRLDKFTMEEIENELNLIRETTDNAMRELRAKIYGLSWKKSGNNSFITDIKAYIDDIKRFNDINIPFYILGNDELLSCKQKKALYRIICEGIGNAVRHGKASNIEISLEINALNIILEIKDNGLGFDLQEVRDNETKGLGIQNLYQLAESLGGNLKIESETGKGTRIESIIPNNVELMKGEKVTV